MRNDGDIVGGMCSATPTAPSYDLVQVVKFQILDTLAVSEASSPYVVTGVVGRVSNII